MESRREFLRNAAVLAGSAAVAETLGLAAALDHRVVPAKSKVVIARDAGLRVVGTQLDEKRVLDLLDRAMGAYTGHEKPAESWRQVVSGAKVVGLKVNGLGGRGISTHAVLVMAIAERLQQAGVTPGNIIVWDRSARDLEACGLTISTDPSRVRVYGSDIAGFEDQPVECGPAKVRLTRILTRDCDMVISVPILKDHNEAGITFSMKNMYGVIDRPFLLHSNYCDPGVADLNLVPVVRAKVRFTIGDALTSVYQGGPGFRPEHLWYPNALVVGEDRVAVDQTAWQMLERKRTEAGLPTLEAEGRPPNYIATAAGPDHKLGTNDPKRIHLVEI